MSSPLSSPQVLFIHGLEGHPNGSKVRMLREQGFDVRAVNMHMSLTQLSKRNSALRNLLRLGEVRASFLVFALVIMASVALSLPALALSTLVVWGWLFFRRPALFAAALNKSFVACVAIQRRAILDSAPDVVVGSSWGGAVAAELIATGAWAGPTVFLAPAVERVSVWTRRGLLDQTRAALHAAAERAPLVIFHDPSDEVVPHADSVGLARDSAIDLRSVDAGGHRLLELLERGELAETIRTLG